jgi:hypothetical protein
MPAGVVMALAVAMTVMAGQRHALVITSRGVV